MTVPRIPQRDHLAKPVKAPRQQLKNDPENNVLLTGHEIQNFQMKTVSVNSIVFTRAMYYSWVPNKRVGWKNWQ